jgi:hypothetical protein
MSLFFFTGRLVKTGNSFFSSNQPRLKNFRKNISAVTAVMCVGWRIIYEKIV